MAEDRKREPDDKEQAKRFIETAKQIGVDESGTSFERAIKTVVSPLKEKPPLPKKKSGPACGA